MKPSRAATRSMPGRNSAGVKELRKEEFSHEATAFRRAAESFRQEFHARRETQVRETQVPEAPEESPREENLIRTAPYFSKESLFAGDELTERLVFVDGKPYVELLYRSGPYTTARGRAPITQGVREEQRDDTSPEGPLSPDRLFYAVFREAVGIALRRAHADGTAKYRESK